MANYHACSAISGRHFYDCLNGVLVEKTPITANNECLARATTNGVKRGLDEVFQVSRLHEDAGFFAQARRTGHLPVDWRGLDGLNLHGSILCPRCACLRRSSTGPWP